MKSKVCLKHRLSASVMALSAAFAAIGPVHADEVNLKSPDGTIDMSGELLSFNDGIYLIRTEIGDLRFTESQVLCEGPGCPEVETAAANATLAGSNTMGNSMIPILISGLAYSMEADAELRNVGEGESLITLIGDQGFGDEVATYGVASSNDSDAFASLLAGEASVGMSTRRITVEEARALRDSGAGSMVSPKQERIVAVDNMVVVTHPSNEVSTLTVDQVRGIFSGEIKNWKEVGGSDLGINVIAAQEDSAGHEFFMNYLFSSSYPDFLPQGIGANDQSVANTIYFDPRAIGYVSLAFLQGTKPISLINECGIANRPDAFSAKTEEYELSRRMYLYSRGDNIDEMSEMFLDFAVSDAADSYIGKSGFIDLGVARRPQDETDSRYSDLVRGASGYSAGYEGTVMSEMLAEMEGYDRLSSTFRFRIGSTRLDERGRLDMERLINYLEGAPEGTEVKFVGFTDDNGAFDANRNLSVVRAEAVMDEVKTASSGRLDHIATKAIGFGEVGATACNASERGQRINRRVEVWISALSQG